VELSKASFVVGRSPRCDLVLDDELVSRKHAVFRLTEKGVEVEDLGSRNGVRVNGNKISGSAPLKHGDLTRIGSQELILQVVSAMADQKRDTPAHTVEIRVCPRCSIPLEGDVVACPHCNAALEPRPAAKAGRSRKQISVSSLRTITEIADKALNLGKHEEAERIVSGLLNNVFLEAEKGYRPDEKELLNATAYALRLAAVTLRPRWIDIVFDLYTISELLMPAETIDHLYSLINIQKYSNTVPIRGYIARLNERAAGYGANERFLMKRIEGMERLVSSN
jgi:pSer/pThr/pTyr-binding forkhead associated (FHA) protein